MHMLIDGNRCPSDGYNGNMLAIRSIADNLMEKSQQHKASYSFCFQGFIWWREHSKKVKQGILGEFDQGQIYPLKSSIFSLVWVVVEDCWLRLANSLNLHLNVKF